MNGNDKMSVRETTLMSYVLYLKKMRVIRNVKATYMERKFFYVLFLPTEEISRRTGMPEV